MREKRDEEDDYFHEHEYETEPPGFEIRLPFGFGWLRGDGTHLAALLPVIRWSVMMATVLYLILKILEASR